MLLLLSFGISCTGCPFPVPEEISEEKQILYETVFRHPIDYPYGASMVPISGGDLFASGDSGVRALSVEDGTLRWLTPVLNPITDMVLMEDYLCFAAYRIDQKQHLWVLDKETGDIRGKLKISIPEDVPILYPDQPIYIFNQWMVTDGARLIFPVNYDHPSYPYRCHGIFSYELNESDLQGETETEVVIRPLVLSSERQWVSSRPLLDGDTAYVYIGGFGTPRPAGPLPEGGQEGYFYTQDQVKVYAVDVLTGNVLWTASPRYVGWLPFCGVQTDGTRLFIGDASGLLALDKATGEILFERPPDAPVADNAIADLFMTYSDGKLYTTRLGKLYCFEATTGKTLWTDENPYTRDSNPVVYGDRVYLADPEGLRAFNKNTGKRLGIDRSLSVGGYRIQGYMPYEGDMMYILRDQEIVAVRLGSEK